MTTNITTVPLQQTPDPDQFIGTETLNSAVDTSYFLGLQNAVFNGDRQLTVNYVLIDNMANDGTPAIGFGSLALQVAPYTRKTFQVPEGSLWCEIVVFTGSVTVVLSTKPTGIPDDANQVAIKNAT